MAAIMEHHGGKLAGARQAVIQVYFAVQEIHLIVPVVNRLSVYNSQHAVHNY